MIVYNSRDYAPATTGYATNYYNFSFIYLMPIFLYRILGFSVVGSTALNYDAYKKTLNITSTSNTTPTTVTTASPHGLTDSTQSVYITGVTGPTNINNIAWAIDVTGPNTFTLRGSYASGAGTGGTATTGFLYAEGLVADGYGAGINFGNGVERDVSIPIEKRKVVSTDIGKILVLKSYKYPTKTAGLFKISAINVGNNTTIAAGSNGQSLPQSTINVVSTTGFPSSGTIFVTTDTGSYAVTYTGTTATSFTGCSGGSGTMSTGGAVANLNRYTVDYRSTENPPSETNNSINWWVYEIENVADDQIPQTSFNSGFTVSTASNTTPITITAAQLHGYNTGQKITVSGVLGNTAANGTWIITVTGSQTFQLNGSSGNGAYTSGGVHYIDGNVSSLTASNSRIMLQSPHSSGWQVRMCAEPRFSALPIVSVAVGFDGNVTGDFPKGAVSTHLASFFDVNLNITGLYANMTPGGGTLNDPIDRITMMGDGYGQNVFVYTRLPSGMLSFGIPDNEPNTLPAVSERIYSYGSANNAASASHVFGGINYRIGTSLNTGVAFSGIPRFAALTSWANLDGTSATSPMFHSNAGDSPFTGTTEVLPVEIWAGTNADVTLNTGATPPFFFDQAYMGTAPFLRAGRSNFGSFTLSTEETTSRAITNATNTSPIQITTSVANALTTGQTVTIYGVLGNTAANGTWTITVINNQNFTLDNSAGNGAFVGATTIAAGSNGFSLPQATINVASTAGFPSSGVIYVITSGGAQTVNYTGTTGTSFTGCTGGTGVMSTGGAVTTGLGNGCPRWIHLQNGVYAQWNGSGAITA